MYKEIEIGPSNNPKIPGYPRNPKPPGIQFRDLWFV